MVVLMVQVRSMNDVSRDAFWFDLECRDIAQTYVDGTVKWSEWIDSGWPQFIGLIYYLIGSSLVYVMLLNAALSGFAAMTLYRMARYLSDRTDVAAATAICFALFPSAVYFHTLPLKEALAVLAVLSIAWGMIRVSTLHDRSGWQPIVLGLLALAALRVYLVLVLGSIVLLALSPAGKMGGVKGLITTFILLAVVAAAIFIAVNTMDLDVDEHETLKYFDLDRLNYTRANLSRGDSRMFYSDNKAVFGTSLIQDVVLVTKGIFFFLVGVDMINIRSLRQAAAVPEALLLILCFPSLIVGVITLWRRKPRSAIPVIIIAIALILVYGSTTTNLGAMYRWRLQALPLLFMFVFIGAAERRKGPFYAILKLFRPRTPRIRPPRFSEGRAI